MSSLVRSVVKNACRLSPAVQCLPPARSFSSSAPPYSDGNFENADGSPVDLTASFASGAVGGGGARYARGYDRIFGKKGPKEDIAAVGGGAEIPADDTQQAQVNRREDSSSSSSSSLGA